MVLIHIKRNDESQFLVETTLKTTIEQLVTNITAIYNGRLKIQRICSEMEELAKYGTLYPPEILGLTEEQVDEMKLVDHWGEKCIPSGGFTIVKDPIGRRNGKQPRKEMQEVIKNTIKEAKEIISKNLVLQHEPLTLKHVQQAISVLKGAVMIVYPMKLPPHDVIRMEFENVEDLTGMQASLEVIDPAVAQLWFCGKEVYRDGKTVGDYVGKVENCKNCGGFRTKTQELLMNVLANNYDVIVLVETWLVARSVNEAEFIDAQYTLFRRDRDRVLTRKMDGGGVLVAVRKELLATRQSRWENAQVIMKISKRGQGPPGREPLMSEDQRKAWMLHAYRKQEELKKLEADDDDSYLNSEWADNGNLKRSFHGINNISWRPGK